MLEGNTAPVVDIWSFQNSGTCPISLAWRGLSEDERARAQRFRAARDRDAFVHGRATIKQILGSYIDCPPEDIQFKTGQHGKPYLPAHDSLHFNWSHAGDRWLMAVTRDGPVGADIEQVCPDLDWRGSAGIAFNPSEISFVERQVSGRARRFYALWVRKEAAFKAVGFGLHNDMAQTTIIDANGSIANQVTMLDGFGWYVHQVPAAAASEAAIAVRFPCARIVLRDLADLARKPTGSRRKPNSRG